MCVCGGDQNFMQMRFLHTKNLICYGEMSQPIRIGVKVEAGINTLTISVLLVFLVLCIWHWIGKNV